MGEPDLGAESVGCLWAGLCGTAASAGLYESCGANRLSQAGLGNSLTLTGARSEKRLGGSRPQHAHSHAKSETEGRPCQAGLQHLVACVRSRARVELTRQLCPLACALAGSGDGLNFNPALAGMYNS